MSGLDHTNTAQLDLIAGHFGKRLKYWRLSRQLTQAELARELHLDGSYISKLESSHRRPSVEIAEQCDELLRTGGELADLVALVLNAPAAAPASAPIPAPPPGPRTGELPPGATVHATIPLTKLAEAYGDVLACLGGGRLGDSAERHAQDVIGMQVGAADAAVPGLLRTAARFARLAAAVRLDDRDPSGAVYWIDCAGRWALDGDDPRLAAEMCARQAIVHTRQSHSGVAVALAVRAEQLAPGDPAAEVWGQLARARALAVDGDPSGVAERLAAVRDLLNRVDGPLTTAPATHTDAFLWHSHAGICHLTLAERDLDATGNGRRAVSHLRTALSEVNLHHTRDLALTRLSLARAHLRLADHGAAAAEIAEAAALTHACASAHLRHRLAETTALLPRS